MVRRNVTRNVKHNIKRITLYDIKSKSYGPKCEMANCRSSLNFKPNKSFFRFPVNNYFCSQWIFLCARPNLVKLYLKRGSIYFYKTKKICEEHFKIEDFKNPALFSQGLYKDAVPTRNLPQLKTLIQIHDKSIPKVNVNEDPTEPMIIMNIKPELKSCQKINECIQTYDGLPIINEIARKKTYILKTKLLTLQTDNDVN